jgi:hypothetical protein
LISLVAVVAVVAMTATQAHQDSLLSEHTELWLLPQATYFTLTLAPVVVVEHPTLAAPLVAPVALDIIQQ